MKNDSEMDSNDVEMMPALVIIINSRSPSINRMTQSKLKK